MGQFRERREERDGSVRFARIVPAMIAIALVVGLNQTTVRGRSSSVLGTKIRRCTVVGSTGRIEIASGARSIRSETVEVNVTGGKLGPALAPAVKVTPGGPQVMDPVSISVGVR